MRQLLQEGCLQGRSERRTGVLGVIARFMFNKRCLKRDQRTRRGKKCLDAVQWSKRGRSRISARSRGVVWYLGRFNPKVAGLDHGLNTLEGIHSLQPVLQWLPYLRSRSSAYQCGRTHAPSQFQSPFLDTR